jgi:hypothetical protein
MSIIQLNTPTSPAPSISRPREISGRSLAQFPRHNGPTAVARLAIDLAAGNVVLTNPTAKQVLQLLQGTAVSTQDCRALRSLVKCIAVKR